MSKHEKLNYVEFASRDLNATKTFFQSLFGWSFTDYGPDYTAFAGEGEQGAGLDGGFYRADKSASAEAGSALLVFYSESLEVTQQNVVNAGGTIVQEIFTFPGGRRFHFTEPGGNEFAVWSDHAPA